jgi:GNAT superfamily N-acetyltransferase
MSTRRITVRAVTDSTGYAAALGLIQAYLASLEIDLGFQDVTAELADLPGTYGPPGGCLLLARVNDAPAGCVGVRPFAGDICELKRLYVRPEQRGLALGVTLSEGAIAAAQRMGYRAMRLDTLPSQQAAHALYSRLGFRANPVPGTQYLERML